MINKDELLKTLDKDKKNESENKKDLELMAEDIFDKLDKIEDVLDLIDLLKGLVKVKGLIL